MYARANDVHQVRKLARASNSVNSSRVKRNQVRAWRTNRKSNMLHKKKKKKKFGNAREGEKKTRELKSHSTRKVVVRTIYMYNSTYIYVSDTCVCVHV